MPSDITRVVLNFKGKDRCNDFQDLTKVVPVVPGRETFVEVRLKPRPKPMLVNASETIEIPMGSDGQSAPVVLSLPPYSLMTEDGEVYNGTANVEVSFADPRNATQIQEADGDFTAISEDGDQQLLDTFGVLKVDFTDLNGKPLQRKADIDVLLDLDEYNITEKEAENIKLWYMDETTGRWRMMDSGLRQHESRRSKRSGRKFFFGRINHTIYHPVNLDSISDDTCFVKIKINDNAAGSASLLSVKITLTTVEGGFNRFFIHTMPTGTWRCLISFCKSLTIRAEIDNNNVLQPNDKLDAALKSKHGVVYYRHESPADRFGNRITIQDISDPTIGGPFSEDCWNTPESLLFDIPELTRSSSMSPDLKSHQRMDQEKRVCFLKIATENSCYKDVTFHVKSTNVLTTPHVDEGFTIVSTSPSNPSTCAEFKCPTERRDMLVTVTALVAGSFTTTRSETEDFKLFLSRGGYKVFVGRVFSFKPNGITYAGIGLVQWPFTVSASLTHDDARNECEKATAGIRFDCTF
jgi:hypothetical protein